MIKKKKLAWVTGKLIKRLASSRKLNNYIMCSMSSVVVAQPKHNDEEAAVS